MISSLIFCFVVGAVLAAEEDSRSAYIKTQENKRLHGYVVKRIDSTDELSCSKACLRHSWCTSSNFKESSGNCELNKHEFSTTDDNTKLTDNPSTTFSMFLKGCLMAGCLNGGSCLFDEGKDAFACSCSPQWRGEKCEMDIDECTSSVRLCDVNATCTNSDGSYICTCKTGFSGDGKTCKDIDECARGTHNCHSSLASCTNTVGSFSCSCNNPYTGNGTTCNLASECQNYVSLNNADRNINYGKPKLKCDSGIGPGWFRFEGSAGTRIPTSCPPDHRCNTDIPGWMDGSHPTVADGQVSRRVCFLWYSNCCRWAKNITVRNCSSYYVYYLSGTPTCNLRYCGTN